jgi:hypothetical protein
MNRQRAEASFDWVTLQAIQEALQHCAGDAIAWNVFVATLPQKCSIRLRNISRGA